VIASLPVKPTRGNGGFYARPRHAMKNHVVFQGSGSWLPFTRFWRCTNELVLLPYWCAPAFLSRERSSWQWRIPATLMQQKERARCTNVDPCVLVRSYSVSLLWRITTPSRYTPP